LEYFYFCTLERFVELIHTQGSVLWHNRSPWMSLKGSSCQADGGYKSCTCS
jgi:hypothetical protein